MIRDGDRVIVNTGGADSYGIVEQTTSYNPALRDSHLVRFEANPKAAYWIPCCYLRPCPPEIPRPDGVYYPAGSMVPPGDSCARHWPESCPPHCRDRGDRRSRRQLQQDEEKSKPRNTLEEESHTAERKRGVSSLKAKV